MVDRLDEDIAALAQDTRDRGIVTAAVVIGVFAGISIALILAVSPHRAVVGLHNTTLAGALLVPFLVSYGLGQAIYRVVRAARARAHRKLAAARAAGVDRVGWV